MRILSLLLCLTLFFRTLPVMAGVTVAPAQIDFRDAFARQQLQVSIDRRDATRQAQYTAGNPQVATVDALGYVTPVANGQTVLTVRWNDQIVQVPVTVSGFDQLRSVDFTTEVEPLLSRYGCNSGGCHGKASGQNGFKLSLFGFDADFDYSALVKEARGRRVFATAPENSLLLTKATGQVPHGGGKRIEPGSESYRLLLSWVKAGAPASAPDVPQVVKLHLKPAEQILQPDQQQQLVVEAEYSNGTRRDVTRDAQYSSNLDVVAVVAEDGLVTANKPTGEAAIMARYQGQVAVCRVLRPQAAPLTGIDGFTPVNFVDQLSRREMEKTRSATVDGVR